MVRATLLFHYKAHQGDLTLEMILWELSAASGERPHRVKYRLYLGRRGRNLLRYDNEAGKGDHRHVGPEEIEEKRIFSTMEELLGEFRAECERLGWRWDE
jgi:hypothetical protein